MRDRDRYDRDNDCRRDVTEALRGYGYAVDAWTIADKPADDDRTITIKVSRNLALEQGEFDLGGGGRSATIDSAAAERLRTGSGML